MAKKKVVKTVVEKESIEKPIEIVLEAFIEDCDGKPKFSVRDENGYQWNVCSISSDGTLLLFTGIPESVGLQVDSEGRIVIE